MDLNAALRVHRALRQVEMVTATVDFASYFVTNGAGPGHYGTPAAPSVGILDAAWLGMGVAMGPTIAAPSWIMSRLPLAGGCIMVVGESRIFG